MTFAMSVTPVEILVAAASQSALESDLSQTTTVLVALQTVSGVFIITLLLPAVPLSRSMTTFKASFLAAMSLVFYRVIAS